MPSAMTHILAARMACENPTALFFIGSIAPDCISELHEKDHSHLRDRADRIAALNALREKTDFSNDFEKGILLHLFLDYKWDNSAISSYKRDFSGNEWVRPYREEISRTSSYIFHNTTWGAPLWHTMTFVPESAYSSSETFLSADIRDYILTKEIWHKEHKLPESKEFSQSYVEDFCRREAENFLGWINS